MSSGQNPFGWAYSYDTLRRIADEENYPGPTGERGDGERKITRPPGVALFGWFLLRLVLGIDMAILFELAGGFVLKAVSYKGKGIADHSNPYFITFMGCVGGAIAIVLLVIIDMIVSKKEKKEEMEERKKRAYERAGVEAPGTATTGTDTTSAGTTTTSIPPTWPGGRPVRGQGVNDANQAIPADETEAAFKTRFDTWNTKYLQYRISNSARKLNLYEEWPHPDGKLRLVHVRYHAMLRLFVWPLLGALSGVMGSVFWDIHKNRARGKATGERIATGVLVQTVGMAVVVLGPTILQIIVLSTEWGKNKIPKKKKTTT